ncbi:hypothetical protein [Paenimyroides aestuarii]|uniref:Uncharacterized protein n=1 Tax=Paenimyroides aestuarii TaxID=2968490 RepID=A0ABY5NTL4_9FLAO|nr:hypothetical protein [Paenimyroides aestuarii]UUV21689.1 hypothetical protein NPX36_01160 [Paenimyroides aestuarii]
MKRVILFFMTISLLSCSKEETNLNDSADFNNIKAKSSGFTVGEIHNDYMDLVNNSFIGDETITNLNDGYGFYYSFLENYTNTYPKFTNDEKSLFLNSYNNHKNLLHSNNVVGIINNNVLIDNPLKNKQTTLSELIFDLKENNVIGNDEFTKINNLQYTLSQAFEGNISYESFDLFIKDLANDVSENDYLLLDPISSIAVHSNDWWTTNSPEIYLPEPIGSVNPEDSNYTTYAVPVVAMDAAGALIGAAGTAINQHYNNNGKITVGAVATGAVIGAVVASTGIVGRLGKWLSRI